MREKLKKLSDLFNTYGIYPKNAYEGSFVKYCMDKSRENGDIDTNDYLKDISWLIEQQDNKDSKKGTDLPYWGYKTLIEGQTSNVMVIGKKSQLKEAGSVVFHANLMPNMDADDYKEYMGNRECFNDYWRLKEYFDSCKLEWSNVYITDALKVDSDENRSILEQEIKIIDPRLIIILGTEGMYTLKLGNKISDFVNGKNPVDIDGRLTIVSYCPHWRTSGYKDKIDESAEIIRKIISNG